MNKVQACKAGLCNVLVFFYRIPSEERDSENEFFATSNAIFKISERRATSLHEMLARDDSSQLQDASILDQTVLSCGGLQGNVIDLDAPSSLSRSQPSVSDDESTSPLHPEIGAPAMVALLEKQLLKQTVLFDACKSRLRRVVAHVSRLEEELSDARALVDWHLCRAAQCV